MPPAKNSTISPGARKLQDQLHELLTRLAGTIDHVKNWPESTDASRHVESTTKLIASIREIVASLQRVEGCIKEDVELRAALQSCLIPMDLLELLDHGLNPDCFCRGLLREATGQLQGLKRRKRALEMLGAAIQQGLDEEGKDKKEESSDTANLKRYRMEDKSDEPPVKKQKSDPAEMTTG